MFLNLLYIILALLGLGFLVFIHELGHYWMARKVGMKVEEFAIGFGKAIKVWEYQGVKWKLCILPFGGQVRIRGENDDNEVVESAGGYFSKHPKKRILVAVIGPVVNFAFAFFAFFLLWVAGGRMQNFSSHTNIIGYVQKGSEAEKIGLESGDQIITVAGIPYESLQDAKVSSILRSKFADFTYRKGSEGEIQRVRIRLEKNQVSPLSEVMPAQFLIYNPNQDSRGPFYPLADKGPIHDTGIQKSDQIIWANGNTIYSLLGLQKVVNTPSAFLTVRRGNEIFQSNVPRVFVKHIQMGSDAKANLDDWRYQRSLSARTGELYFIPYEIKNNCQIERSISFINEDFEEVLLIEKDLAKTFIPLQPGDQIIAVNGKKVKNSQDLLEELQQQKILLLIKRDPIQEVSWKNEDTLFLKRIENRAIAHIVSKIGTSSALVEENGFFLLPPIVPKMVDDLTLSPTMRAMREELYYEERMEIEKIEDLAIRQRFLQKLENHKKSLKLGLPLQELQVKYNPGPIKLFQDALSQTWFCLVNLIKGSLSPKNLSGPVGIIYVIQASIANSIKDGLYWLGFISLNLGFLNLLPIPVLDGGHICFSLWEWITGKKLSAKTMQKILIPFFILLICFFIFVTFQDLRVLFRRFF